MQHVAEADDGVQRRAQFVAHIGEELRLGLVGLDRVDARGLQRADHRGQRRLAVGDRAGHVDDRAVELADLVLGAERRRRGVVAAGDAPRRGGKRLQRTRALAHDQHRAQRGQEQRAREHEQHRRDHRAIGRERFCHRIGQHGDHRRAVRCGLERGGDGEELRGVGTIDDRSGLMQLARRGQGDRLRPLGGACRDGPTAMRVRRRQGERARGLGQKAQLLQQRVVDRHAGGDEGDRHRRADRHDDDPVDPAAQRRQRGALAGRRGIVEQIGIDEGMSGVACGAGVGGDRPVEADEHHARRADAPAVVAQGGKLRAVIVLRDGLAQGEVQRQHMDVVADAVGKDAELPEEHVRRAGELGLLLVH